MKRIPRKSDGCPTFASAYSGFPVELACVEYLHAALLDESRTRGCWWRLVQEIRIRGPKTMGAAQQSLFATYRTLAAALSIAFHSSAESCNFAAAIFSSRCVTEEVPGIGIS